MIAQKTLELSDADLGKLFKRHGSAGAIRKVAAGQKQQSPYLIGLAAEAGRLDYLKVILNALPSHRRKSAYNVAAQCVGEKINRHNSVDMLAYLVRRGTDMEPLINQALFDDSLEEGSANELLDALQEAGVNLDHVAKKALQPFKEYPHYPIRALGVLKWLAKNDYSLDDVSFPCSRERFTAAYNNGHDNYRWLYNYDIGVLDEEAAETLLSLGWSTKTLEKKAREHFQDKNIIFASKKYVQDSRAFTIEAAKTTLHEKAREALDWISDQARLLPSPAPKR